MRYRVRLIGLTAFRVGGGEAVSHQLYDDPNYHLHFRRAGIEYLRENPESFIESNREDSWNDYLSNMPLQGSWCYELIVQVVAESHNIRIHIVEFEQNFAETTWTLIECE